jgi:RNA polymerase sigma-70 factor (ECF subfamily)
MVSMDGQWGVPAASGCAAERRSPRFPGEKASAGAQDLIVTEETALLRAGRAGDRAALDALLALHERALFALCHGILGHAEDAEDAAQETFLRALRGLAGFREEAGFRTWLFRIALNVCLGRKSSQRPALAWEDEQSPPAAAGASPEAIALRQLRIQEALAGLLPRQRALLLLKEREGWSMREIAAALQWSERQVRYELSKTRLALAEWRRRDEDPGGER